SGALQGRLEPDRGPPGRPPGAAEIQIACASLTTRIETNHGNRNPHDEGTFNAAPEEVFHALMDSAKHTQFTGAPATIARKPGGEFCLYGGQLTGKTLELKPNQRMVQQCGERTGSRATFHCSRSISRRWMAAGRRISRWRQRT